MTWQRKGCDYDIKKKNDFISRKKKGCQNKKKIAK
jgi:hypothetical protein